MSSSWKPEYNNPRNSHYKSVRQHFINILGGKCSVCGSTENLEIDHIIPNGWGMGRGQQTRMWDWFPSYAENNLQLLCSTHNKEKHHTQHKPID